MPRFQPILNPLEAERMRARGYVQLPNGEWGTQEQYNRARERIRQRGQEALRNSRPGDPRSAGRHFWDNVAQYANSETVQQIGNGIPSPIGWGVDYALGDFSRENPLLGLLFNSVIKGGIAAATTGNPLVGVGVAVKNTASNALDAWQVHKAVEDKKENQNDKTSSGGSLPFGFHDWTNEDLEEADIPIRFTPDTPLFLQTGDNVLLEELRGQAAQVLDSTAGVQNGKGFSNLQIQRTDSFSITPKLLLKVPEKAKRAKPANRLAAYSPLSVLFGGV